MKSRKCPWCGEPNPGTLKLCPTCEQLATEGRAKRGAPIRMALIQPVHEEPDD